MARTPQNSGKVQRRTAIGFLALMGLLAPALPAAAAPPWEDPVFVLEGATATEGIAAGEGTTFYAGDRLLGDIYRGDISTGENELFIDAPAGRVAIGMKVDTKNDLLFVAGGGTGDAYVYSTETGATVAVLELTEQEMPFINDVTLTRDGAWFTNSRAPELYFVPISQDGVVGDEVTTLALTGPAAETWEGNGPNGIASAQGGRVLILAHSAFQGLYTVDPVSGATARIELRNQENQIVPLTAVDGILVQGHQVWAVQNRLNQISRIKLSGDFSSGTVVDVITSRSFDVPTTVALFANTLAAVNAQFGRPASPYEVVLVPARG